MFEIESFIREEIKAERERIIQSMTLIIHKISREKNKPMDDVNPKEVLDALEESTMIKNIGDLFKLWKVYIKDPKTLYNPNPPLGVVISFEGFWLWLLEKNKESTL